MWRFESIRSPFSSVLCHTWFGYFLPLKLATVLTLPKIFTLPVQTKTDNKIHHCILTFGLRKENCRFDIFLNTNLYILLTIELYFLMFILFNVLCIVPTIIVSNIAINPWSLFHCPNLMFSCIIPCIFFNPSL